MKRRVLYHLHAWIGVNLGLLLFAICFSGTVAVFSPELHWLVDPAMRAEKRNGGTISWQAIYDSAAQAHPHARVLSLHAPRAEGFAAAAVIAYSASDFRTVLTDPQTGAVQAHRSSFGLVSFLRIFHKQLYIVPTILGFHGTLIVGVLAVPLLIASVAGLLSVRRWWRAAFTLRLGRSPRLFWSDLHRAAGVWSLVISILLCLTGIWYFAEILLQGGGLVAEDRRPPRLAPEIVQNRPDGLAMIDLDHAVRLARDAFPELTVTQVRLPGRQYDVLSFAGPADAWLVRDRSNSVHLDPATGAVIEVRRASQLEALDRWIETADPLHFGTFGGVTTRILWCLAGLALCGGILAGLYGAWLRLRKAGHGLPRSRIVATMTVLPTLVLLLASLHGAWAYGMRRAALPVVSGMSPGEVAVIALFVFCMLLPFIGWARLQFAYRPH